MWIGFLRVAQLIGEMLHVRGVQLTNCTRLDLKCGLAESNFFFVLQVSVEILFVLVSHQRLCVSAIP